MAKPKAETSATTTATTADEPVRDVKLLRILPDRTIRCWDVDMIEIRDLWGDWAEIDNVIAKARARLRDDAQCLERKPARGDVPMTVERFDELERMAKLLRTPEAAYADDDEGGDGGQAIST